MRMTKLSRYLRQVYPIPNPTEKKEILVYPDTSKYMKPKYTSRITGKDLELSFPITRLWKD